MADKPNDNNGNGTVLTLAEAAGATRVDRGRVLIKELEEAVDRGRVNIASYAQARALLLGKSDLISSLLVPLADLVRHPSLPEDTW